MRKLKERIELQVYYIKKYIAEFLYCNREKIDLRKNIFRLRAKSVWLFCVEKYYRFQNWILKQKNKHLISMYIEHCTNIMVKSQIILNKVPSNVELLSAEKQGIYLSAAQRYAEAESGLLQYLDDYHKYIKSDPNMISDAAAKNLMAIIPFREDLVQKLGLSDYHLN